MAMLEPGFYPGMPASEYHAIDALSRSVLVRMKRSPAHSRVPVNVTQRMEAGTAAHYAILEKEKYTKKYIMASEDMKLTNKDGKAWKKEQEKKGKIVLPRGGRETSIIGGLDIEGMVKAVEDHDEASQLLSSGMAELSAFWEDEETGVPCKCRADFVNDAMIILDIKTTSDSRPPAFNKKIADMKYHYHAWYLDGFTKLTGLLHNDFRLIAIEAKEPWGVWVHKLSQEDMDIAYGEYRPLVHKYAECRNSNKWPCYNEPTTEASLPPWAKPKY